MEARQVHGDDLTELEHDDEMGSGAMRTTTTCGSVGRHKAKLEEMEMFVGWEARQSEGGREALRKRNSGTGGGERFVWCVCVSVCARVILAKFCHGRLNTVV